MEALFHSLEKKMQVDWIDTPEQYRKAYQYFTEAEMSHTRGAGYGAPFLSLEEGVAQYVSWLKKHEVLPDPRNLQ
jgi:ADP-L-glycero-D-manno-heptose 6-epimerase